MNAIDIIANQLIRLNPVNSFQIKYIFSIVISIPFNALQNYSVQLCWIQFCSLQFNSVEFYATQFTTVQLISISINYIQLTSIELKSIQFTFFQYNSTLFSSIKLLLIQATQCYCYCNCILPAIACQMLALWSTQVVGILTLTKDLA